MNHCFARRRKQFFEFYELFDLRGGNWRLVASTSIATQANPCAKRSGCGNVRS